ncbi:hypothetical protein IWX91DRAFT_67119 [Phyllosticta citricarpa]
MRWRGDHCLVASNVVLGLASRTTEMILEAAVCLIQSLISKMWSCWQVPGVLGPSSVTFRSATFFFHFCAPVLFVIRQHISNCQLRC